MTENIVVRLPQSPRAQKNESKEVEHNIWKPMEFTRLPDEGKEQMKRSQTLHTTGSLDGEGRADTVRSNLGRSRIIGPAIRTLVSPVYLYTCGNIHAHMTPFPCMHDTSVLITHARHRMTTLRLYTYIYVYSQHRCTYIHND